MCRAEPARPRNESSCALPMTIARPFTKPIMHGWGTRRMNFPSRAAPTASCMAPVSATLAKRYSGPCDATRGARTTAVAPAAPEITPGCAPSAAVTRHISAAACRPTMGETPATNVNARDSGTIASDTVTPASICVTTPETSTPGEGAAASEGEASEDAKADADADADATTRGAARETRRRGRRAGRVGARRVRDASAGRAPGARTRTRGGAREARAGGRAIATRRESAAGEDIVVRAGVGGWGGRADRGNVGGTAVFAVRKRGREVFRLRIGRRAAKWRPNARSAPRFA